MEMDKYTKDLELIFKNEDYALYVNRDTKEISFLSYSEDDLRTIPLTDLGNFGFKS